MPFAARHRADPTPALEPLPGLVVARETSVGLMAQLQGRDEAEMATRFEAGHRGYVARLDGEPAAWDGLPRVPRGSGSSTPRSTSRAASATSGTS